MLISTRVACVATLVVVLPTRPGIPQALVACRTPANPVSVSQINVVQGAAEIYMEKPSGSSKVADGVIRLYLMNEGPAEPDHLCASAYLTDPMGKPQDVYMALSQPGLKKPLPNFEKNTACFKIEPSWRAFQEMFFDLRIRVDSSLIPLSGPIGLSSTAISNETSVPEPAAQNGKTPKRAGGGRKSANSTPNCVTSSKLLTQSVMLLPSLRSSWLEFPLSGALGTALAYLLISLWVLRKKLEEPVGGPQWNFTTSFATNFTIGTGLLTPLIGANVMTDALHYMTKFHYALFAILFAALLLLAPAVFSFFSTPRQLTTPTGQTSTVSVGSVGLFLATSALMIGAVIGQLITVGLAIAEIRFRGYIGSAPMAVILCLLAVAGFGTIVSAVSTIRSYITPKPVRVGPSREHLRSISQKFASIQPEAAFESTESDLFSDQDREVIEHVARGPQPEMHSWKMF
jgi:hypothetical protein